jgi:hypothetical protein
LIDPLSKFGRRVKEKPGEREREREDNNGKLVEC